MICNHRIYKGEDVDISVPFLTQGWSDLYVEYFTDGAYKVVKQEAELDIDEYTITATFGGSDLDLLADGVLNYTIHYVYDGENYIKCSNTPYILKTANDYNAKTEHEIYVEGKAAGYISGFTQGYEQGQQDCPECSGSSCNLQAGELNIDTGWTGSEIVTPDQGYDGFNSFEVSDMGYGDAKYNEGYVNGEIDTNNATFDNSITLSVSANGTYYAETPSGIYYKQVNVNVPQSSGGGSCNLEVGSFALEQDFSGTTLYPTTGDGFSSVEIYDSAEGYWYKNYNDGYSSLRMHFWNNQAYFCPTDIPANTEGADAITYSVYLYRENEDRINGGFNREFIIYSCECGDCTDNSGFKLTINDDNVVKFVADDDEDGWVLSAQTSGEYLNIDVTFSADTITMSILNRCWSGTSTTTLSCSGTNFYNDYMMTRQLCINGSLNGREGSPLYYGISDACYICLDNLSVYNNGGLEYCLRYKDGGLYDIVNGNSYPFYENYLGDYGKWKIREVPYEEFVLDKCIIGQGGV